MRKPLAPVAVLSRGLASPLLAHRAEMSTRMTLPRSATTPHVGTGSADQARRERNK